jgi:hypothetical protein
LAAFELVLAYVAPGERRRRRSRLRRNTASRLEWPIEQSAFRRLPFCVPTAHEVIRFTGYMGPMDKSTLLKLPGQAERFRRLCQLKPNLRRNA